VNGDWQDANNDYLAAALHWLRLVLRRHAQTGGHAQDGSHAQDGIRAQNGRQAQNGGPAPRTALVNVGRKASKNLALPAGPDRDPAAVTDGQVTAARQAWTAAADGERAPALVELSDRLGLSPFEQKILLLCAAIELDPAAPGLCALAQRDERKPWPTFALALELFDDPSWEALSPRGPLRDWRLVEITQLPGQPLTGSALRADERIVSYIKGLNYLDDRLEPLLTAIPAEDGLPASQRVTATAVLEGWARSAELTRAPVVQLLGQDGAAKLSVAADAAGRLGCQVYRLPVGLLPSQATDLETAARLWSRESLLLPLVLYLDAHSEDGGAPDRAVGRFLANSSGLFLLGTREAWPELMPAASVVDVARPTPAEQHATWLRTLGPGAEPTAGQLAGQFDFDAATIDRIARTAAGHDAGEQLPRLWDASAAICRPRMDALAQRIDGRATWDDLVLPEPELELLRQIADQVRHRADVYNGGGFGERLSRGLGITALFAGPSGTGKTMAGEVLAADLRLSLYRIDLSAVVSKYIGETEKNLRRVFEAAEQGAAVLFFDEADALFGKRSEVKDSHDRYANIEVNYLLQRMESYRGVAVLATNMRSALDQAFMRRLRFVVTFPYPAAAERRLIWSRVFPSRTQTAGLDLDRLAGLTATGGMIHNIALNAAFLAARDATPVTMPLVLQAARAEFRKLELPVSEGDFAWPPEVVR
jgi:ATPase family associated with various cellular activities (AAA)/Winged helix domain, variant